MIDQMEASNTDNRPRNSTNQRRIQHMFSEDVLLKEPNKNYYDNTDGQHSIESALEDTDKLQEWARKKRQGTNVDPENRRPVQLSDTPLSDLTIELTRYDGSAALSSLSSLHVPHTSNPSLTITSASRLSHSNPNPTPRRTRQSEPAELLRQRQMANLQIRKSVESRKSKRFSASFKPPLCSTPTTQPNVQPIFDVINGERPVVSPINVDSDDELHETLVNQKAMNVSHNSNRTLTQKNQSVRSKSQTIVPETQPNDSVIPETQDDPIPETQDCHIPETQEDYVPETQEDYVPETQENDELPTQNGEDQEYTSEQQQAEPQENLNKSKRNRVHSRLTLNGLSSPNLAAKSLAPSTPSRIPVMMSRASQMNNKTTNVTNAKSELNGEQLVVALASPATRQPLIETQALVSAAAAAPSIADHANLNGETPANASLNHSKRNHSNTKQIANNNNGLKNRSELANSRANDSASFETPLRSRTSMNNSTGVRKLSFNEPELNVCDRRRSATFNKTDNLSKTFHPTVTLRDRTQSQSMNRQSLSLNGISRIATPESQEPSKRKISIENATYDISRSNRRASRPQNGEINTATFLSSINRTENDLSMGKTADSMANLPSEAQLDSMNITKDDNNINVMNRTKNQTASNSRNDQNNGKKPTLNVSELLGSQMWSPVVRLSRLTVNHVPQNVTVYTPPSQFRNNFDDDDDDEIDDHRIDDSPSVCAQREKLLKQRNFAQSGSDESANPPAQTSRRRRTKEQDEYLAVGKSLAKKKNSKRSSGKPQPRRLTSQEELRGDASDSSDNEESAAASRASTQPRQSQSTSANNAAVFKVPEVPVRKSIRSTRSKNSIINATSQKSQNHQPASDHIDDGHDDQSVDLSVASSQVSAKRKGGKTKKPSQTVNQCDSDASTKLTSKSRSKPKSTRDNNANETETGTRRSTRERRTNGFRMEFMMETMNRLQKRLKSDSTPRPTVKQRETQNSEPPRKKARSQRPPAAPASESSAYSAITVDSESTRAETAPKRHKPKPANGFKDYVKGATERRLNMDKWWKEMVDIEHENINTEEDLAYIHTSKGLIEYSSTGQIEYSEVHNVRYGFMECKTRRYGYMRFPAGSNKPYGRSSAELSLFVMQGIFCLRDEDGENEVLPCSEVTIPKGASYELKNCGEGIGIIQFTYVAEY